MTKSDRLLVVLGATGSQGSAVLHHFLRNEPTYRLRGTTRNPNNPKALALAAQGIEIVQADLDDATSLTEAFHNATHIYAYTDSTGCAYSPQAQQACKSGLQACLPDAATAMEIEQGKNLASAAAGTSTLEKLVWSSCADTSRLAEGKYYCYSMVSKASIQRHLRSVPELRGKVDVIFPAVFTESFVRFANGLGWTKTGEKSYAFRVPWDPKTKIPWIDLEQDLGSWVDELFNSNGEATVVATSGEMSTEDVVGIMREQVSGVKIEVQRILLDEYAAPDPTGIMKDVGRCLSWNADKGVKGEDPEAVDAEDFARTHSEVKRSDLTETFKALDWASMLKPNEQNLKLREKE